MKFLIYEQFFPKSLYSSNFLPYIIILDIFSTLSLILDGDFITTSLSNNYYLYRIKYYYGTGTGRLVRERILEFVT